MGVSVEVGDGVNVSVGVEVGVGVSVSVGVNVKVEVGTRVSVGVKVDGKVGARVVLITIGVSDGEAVKVLVATFGTHSCMPARI